MLFDIIFENEPPPAFSELEDRIMSAMYPIERLTWEEKDENNDAERRKSGVQ